MWSVIVRPVSWVGPFPSGASLPRLAFNAKFLFEGADGRLHGVFVPGYPLFLAPFPIARTETPVEVEPTSCSFADCRLAAQTPASQRPRQESNLVCDLRRVACDSVTLQGQRTRVRTAGVQGFEPCARVLEARYSPRSTPLCFGQIRVFGGS